MNQSSNDDRLDSQVEDSPVDDEPNSTGDRMNVFILILLYIQQSVSQGFFQSMSTILLTKEYVSKKDWAKYVLMYFPFNLNIFLAPVVDSVCVKQIGRRKSWILPCQYLIGALFLYLASNIHDWIDIKSPKITNLCVVFLCINFLSSMLDLSIDGWATTILKNENVGFLSTCKTTGHAIGTMLGYFLPIMLYSEEFSNTYLRSSPEKGGVMSLEGFLYFYGSFFFLANKLIAFVIKEEHYSISDFHSTKLGVGQAYSLFFGIFKLSAFWKLTSALLTLELGFAAVRHLSGKKLEEYGLRHIDDFSNTAMLYVIQMIIPIAFCKYTSGTEPLSVLIKIIPYRLFFGLLMISLVYYAPNIMIQNKNNYKTLPLDYFLLLETIQLILEGMALLFKILLLSFFFRISDHRIGATYMTLLFKLTVYGGDFAKSMLIGMRDWLSYKRCSTDTNNDCSTIRLTEGCISIQGSCLTIVDGYYCTVILSTVFGTIWYIYYRKVLKNLQYNDLNRWWPKSSRSSPKNGHQMQSILSSKSIHSNTY